MRKNIQIILLQLLTPLICGFPTSTITGWDNVYTRTHRDMLEVGLRKAVGHFLLENNYFESDMNDMALPLIVDTFFGNGKLALAFCMCRLLLLLNIKQVDNV